MCYCKEKLNTSQLLEGELINLNLPSPRVAMIKRAWPQRMKRAWPRRERNES